MFEDIDSLIRYLDDRYLQSCNSTNYGELLKSMAEDNSIRSIMAKCEKIRAEICLQPYSCHCSSLLLSYFDKCVLDCYKRRESKSLKDFCKAYINIRKENDLKQEVKRIAIARGLDIDQTASELDNALKKYDKLRAEITEYNEKSNGFKKLYLQLREVGMYLIKHHYMYIKAPTPSLYNNDGLFIEKWLQRIVNERKKRKNNLFWIPFSVLATILIAALFFGIDHTTTYCLFVILLIAGLLKHTNPLKKQQHAYYYLNISELNLYSK